MKESLLSDFPLKNINENEVLKKYSRLNKQDPYTSSGPIKRLLVIWAFNIIKLSNLLSLKPEYLGSLPEKLQSKNFINDLKEIWFIKNYKNKKFHPLIRAAFVANKILLVYVMVSVFFRSIMEAIRLSLFREFMSRFSKETTEKKGFYSLFSQYQIGFLLIFFRIVHVLLWRKTTEYQCLLGYKVTAQFQSLIFEKLLKISPSSMKERVDTGQVINFIQSDSQKLTFLMWCSPDIFCMPIQVIIYCVMLYQILGGVFFCGLIILILFIYGNLSFQKKIKALIKVHVKLKDKRMKVTTETFNNIKILKLYSWEDEFKNKINLAREDEIANLLKKFRLSNLNNTIQWAGPVITSVVSIGLFQYIKGVFKIEDIFTALGLFNRLQWPLRFFPEIMTNFYETTISMGRIENYLKQDEVNEANVIKNDENIKKNDIRIKIENGSFSWGIPPISEKKQKEKEEEEKKKKKEKKKNKSNKITSLIPKEIELLDSDSKNKNDVNNKSNNYSMISQINSLYQTYLTENDDSSKKVINPLNPILKNINFEIKNGEFICIIGEVGSGKSSLLQSILNNLIPLNPKTKIYLNGSVSYVSQVPWICNATVKSNILFHNSFIEEKYNKVIELSCLRPDLEILEGGDLTEIGEKGINLSGGQKARIALARALYSDNDIFIFDDPISALDANVGMKVMKNCILGHLKEKTRILATHALQYISFADRIIYMSKGEIKWVGSYNEIKGQNFFLEFYEKMQKTEEKKRKNSDEKREEFLNNNDDKNDKDSLNTGVIKRITKDEKMEKERIKFIVFKSFVKNMGGVRIPLTIITFQISMAIFKASSDIFLGFWSTHQSKTKNNKFFLMYSLLCLGSCLFNYCLLRISTNASIVESRKIHTLMIDSLIGAPVPTFHETTPKGQIFNRLSKDIESIDNNAVNQMNNMFASIIDFFSSLVICAFFEPYVLILAPILIYIGYRWALFNIKCSRELYRIEGIVRSPILNLTNEAIPGSIVIRAFNAEKSYLDRFYKSIDEHFKVRIILNGTNNLHDLFLDSLSITLATFLILFSLIFKDKFSASEIGLILSYYETIHGSIFRGLHTLKFFQNSMVDFERCMHFTECPKESPKENDYSNSLGSWPSKGKIQFENFSVKYREDTEIVLKNLNFLINPKEKIGVVGRTGSGKSTVTLCLFRILEATSGKILIDDIDISKIGLNKLRRNLTIIPQDPSLMEGTLRYNIDPLNLSSNENILKVMKSIGFDYIVDRDPEGLLQEISEGGSNLSVGEKQLICITRAILRKSRIIIMDEATASIDYKTEEIIQKAINEILNESTVITIAHRIKTILNYDKILALDNGEIVDFDTPKNLLEKKKGVFYELYHKSTL